MNYYFRFPVGSHFLNEDYCQPDLKMSASAFPKRPVSCLPSFVLAAERLTLTLTTSLSWFKVWAETMFRCLYLWKKQKSSKNIIQWILLYGWTSFVLYFYFILFWLWVTTWGPGMQVQGRHTLFLPSRLIGICLLKHRQAEETRTFSVFEMTTCASVPMACTGPNYRVTLEMQGLDEADSTWA